MVPGGIAKTAKDEWRSRCHMAVIAKAVDDNGSLNIKVHDANFDKTSPTSPGVSDHPQDPTATTNL